MPATHLIQWITHKFYEESNYKVSPTHSQKSPNPLSGAMHGFDWNMEQKNSSPHTLPDTVLNYTAYVVVMHTPPHSQRLRKLASRFQTLRTPLLKASNSPTPWQPPKVKPQLRNTAIQNIRSLVDDHCLVWLLVGKWTLFVLRMRSNKFFLLHFGCAVVLIISQIKRTGLHYEWLEWAWIVASFPVTLGVDGENKTACLWSCLWFKMLRNDQHIEANLHHNEYIRNWSNREEIQGKPVEFTSIDI